MALKTLIEGIEIRAPIAAVGDRDENAKSRIFLQAVSAEAWCIHAEAELAYLYYFASVVDALHAFIRAVQAHEAHRRTAGAPADTL